MTNREFYAFCKAQCKIEPDEHKRNALADLYQFGWECGITKDGVKSLIETRVYQNRENAKKVEAYQWAQGVFLC